MSVRFDDLAALIEDSSLVLGEEALGICWWWKGVPSQKQLASEL